MEKQKDQNEAACGGSDVTAALGVDACPVCGRTWPHPSEQGRCVELFGECIVCRFVPLGTAPNWLGSGSGTDEEFVTLSTPNAELTGRALGGSRAASASYTGMP